MENQTNSLVRSIAEKDDNTAFKQLFHQFSPELASYLETFVQSAVVADEIVSEIFARLWINRKNLLEIENISAYLFKSAKNESIKYLQRERGRAILKLSIESSTVQVPDGTPNPHELLTYKELYGRIEEAIESLPPQCKEVFKLVKHSGMKYREAAEVLGISKNTVENQMVKALKHIRHELSNFFSENRNEKNASGLAMWALLLLFPQFFEIFLQQA